MTVAELQQDYDWRSAFEYADARHIEPSLPGMDVALNGFGIEDIQEVFFADPGEREGPDWVIAGKLKDGRYFGLRAGCDYTGWG